MQFRPAKIKEAKIIQKIADEGKLTSYPILFYATMAMMGLLYVMDNEGKIAGFVCFCPMPIGEEAFIFQICLENNYQSKGIGKNLLSKTYEILSNKFKVSKIWAHTIKERSLSFFKREKWKIMLSLFNVTIIRKTISRRLNRSLSRLSHLNYLANRHQTNHPGDQQTDHQVPN